MYLPGNKPACTVGYCSPWWSQGRTQALGARRTLPGSQACGKKRCPCVLKSVGSGRRYEGIELGRRKGRTLSICSLFIPLKARKGAWWLGILPVADGIWGGLASCLLPMGSEGDRPCLLPTGSEGGLGLLPGRPPCLLPTGSAPPTQFAARAHNSASWMQCRRRSLTSRARW
jgi:hypothetical protein